MNIPMDGGKYDEECGAARRSADAVAAILIIIEGNRGTGFSVHSKELALIPNLPTLLRVTADDIEKQLRLGLH